MRLTLFSDYALHMLMSTQAAGDRLLTIEEMADANRISRAHLMKVATTLTRAGYLVAPGAARAACGLLSRRMRSCSGT